MGADTVAIGQWNENEVMARLSPEEIADASFP
jgi:hypothetical protein